MLAHNTRYVSLFLFLLHLTESLCSKIEMQPRIFGGTVAQNHQFPYVGYLVVGKSNKLCGVTAIHPRWILTAAHCLQYGIPKIVLGTNHYKGPEARTYFAETIISHEGFEDDDAGDDIGLVRLTTAIEFSDTVQLAKLPNETYENYEDAYGTLCGWGTTSEELKMSKILQKAKFHIVSIDVCDELMDDRLEDEYFICASNEVNQQACPGDSGSPLIHKGVQIGILSMAKLECDGTSSSAFTRISAYVPWIEEQLDTFDDEL